MFYKQIKEELADLLITIGEQGNGIHELEKGMAELKDKLMDVCTHENREAHIHTHGPYTEKGWKCPDCDKTVYYYPGEYKRLKEKELKAKRAEINKELKNL